MDMIYENNACDKIVDTNSKKDLILVEILLRAQSFDFLNRCIPLRCKGGRIY